MITAIGKIGRICEQQIAGSVNRIEKIAQDELHVSNPVHGGVESRELERARADVDANNAPTVFAGQNRMHTGARSQIDGALSWITLYHSAENKTLPPKPHHLVDAYVLTCAVGNYELSVAREKAQPGIQNRAILFRESSLNNRVDKS